MSSKKFLTEDLLRLYDAPNVGPATFIAIVDEFGSPAEVFNRPAAELSRIKGVTRDRASAILSTDSTGFIDKQLDAVKRTGCNVISYWDEEYPARLKAIYDPPPFYFIKGEIAMEDAQSLAVVGTRKITDYGRTQAERIVTELVKEGLTIVSGLASGVDTAAHRAALDAGGRTIAVLGSGLDRIYPQQNAGLSRRIIDSGALISEFPMGAAPDRGNFPQRNRIISGLSLGTLVVEGGGKSGALITAFYAVDQNREVFALPGRVDSKMSAGPNRLIKHGAKLVSSAEDILVEIENLMERRRAPRQTTIDFKLSADEAAVVEAIDAEPLHIDDIAEKCDITTSQALATLLGLELRSVVRQLPGKMFTRIA